MGLQAGRRILRFWVGCIVENTRRKRMYKNIEGMMALAEARGCSLGEIILLNETKHTEKSREAVLAEMEKRMAVMRDSAEKAINRPELTGGSLISGMASAQAIYGRRRDSLCGSFVNLVMARALSGSEVNASMGRICAMPTAGACGIVPAVLLSAAQDRGIDHQALLMGFITAAGVGAVITENATVSGAEGGCQAECGAAAAMAAAGAAEMLGGKPRVAGHACAFALMNCMGLVCDPVAGLVQIPCAQRNASQAVNALLSADLALAGMESVIPPDQVIEAMYRTGRLLPPQLKETALGGIAATEAARGIAEKVLSQSWAGDSCFQP